MPANQTFLSLQGKPVFLEETTQARNQPRNPIVAGNIEQSRPTSSVTDPWLASDPWTKYRSTTAPVGNATAPATARPVSGPAQAAFAEQSTRIDRIEQEIESMKQSQVALQTELKHQGQVTDNKLQTMEKNVSQAMTSLSQQVQKSIADQGAHQDKQMSARFDELKQLFKNRPKRKADLRSPMKAQSDTKGEKSGDL